MKWKLERADKFCKSVRDGTHDTPKQVDFGFKLITAKNIKNGQVDLGDAYNISEKDYIKINERSKVEKWDVLMSMIGNGLGRSAVIKDNPKYAIKNLALFKIGNEVKAKWLHYFLCSNEGQGIIFNTLQGSGQPFISLNLLRGLLIPVPPLTVMKKVIKILSLYDDLIENNQKQIKLLEEAAQRLYKEWFVDLRFPGYENTPIIDGVPEGWSKKQLVNVFDYVRGKSYSSKEIVNSGNTLLINLKNIRAFGGYNRNAEKYYVGKYGDSQKVQAGDIIMSVTDMTQERRLVGHVAIVPNIPKTMIFSMDLIKLIPLTVKNSFLYSTMFFGGYSKRIATLANGTNVLHLKPESMMNMELLVPSNEIMIKYDDKFRNFYQRIEVLENQNIILAEARGRLLPKLMNGEVEV